MPLITLFVVVYLNSSVFYVGVVFALSSLASVPALIIWGNLSDRFKKRKIFIIIGFFGSFLSLILVFFINSIPSYILMLVLFQIITMASTPVSTLLILENSPKSAWASIMGKFNAYSALGTVMGLAMGVVVLMAFGNYSHIIIKYLYVIAAFIYLIAGILSIFVLKEPRKKINRDKLNFLYTVRVIERIRYIPTHILHIPKIKNEKRIKIPGYLKNYLIMALIFMTGFQLFFVPYPVFMIREFNATNNEVFIMFLLSSLMSATTYMPASRYMNYIGSNKMLSYAIMIRIMLFITVGTVSFFIIDNVFYLIFYIAMYGIFGALWSFIGLSEVTSISNMSDAAVRGKVIGFYNSFNGIGQIVGSGLSGIIAISIGYSGDFFISALVVLSGFIILIKTNPPDIETLIRRVKSRS